MLIDEVVYDASTREFEIKLNAPGIQLLAQEGETRETA